MYYLTSRPERAVLEVSTSQHSNQGLLVQPSILLFYDQYTHFQTNLVVPRRQKRAEGRLSRASSICAKPREWLMHRPVPT